MPQVHVVDLFNFCQSLSFYSPLLQDLLSTAVKLKIDSNHNTGSGNSLTDDWMKNAEAGLGIRAEHSTNFKELLPYCLDFVYMY